MAEAVVLESPKIIPNGEGKEAEHSVVRRIGEYHANVWDKDFLQSLASPFGASSYREEVEVLIKEIKFDVFNGLLGDGESNPSPYDLLQIFSIVDVVQRLGIGRYFDKEIKAVLDYCYKHWNEKGISWGRETAIADLHTTALGFRVLRLNEYPVSPDVFQNFKDKNGQFVIIGATNEDESQLRCMLSLYRASEISFPGENIMREAKAFASEYLQKALEESQQLKDKTQLLSEIEYDTKYPWRCKVPRWEAWNSIQIFRQDINTWMLMEGVYKIPSESCKKILNLAILDFNILQAQHQAELKYLSEWWDEATVRQLSFFRHRHVEYYFWYTCGLYEPEYAATRLCYAKLGTVITVVDDIFDTYGTIEELIPFREALINWDMSMMDRLPDFMQISLQFAYKIYMEIAVEAEKIHGPRVQKWMRDYWKTLIWAEFQDAEWIANDYQPTLPEYLKNSLISSTVPVVTFFPMILIDTYLPDDILKRVNKFESSVAWGCRLIDDSKDFQDEQEHGETASWIECYVRDNPEKTRDQALDHMNMLIDLNIEELSKERLFYKHDIPTCSKRLYFDSMYRSVAFIWRDVDGFSHSRKGTKDDIMKILVEPIPL